MPDALQLLSFGPTGWGDEILAGAWLTIRLALATLPLGLAIGFLVALMRRSGSRRVRRVAEAYSTVFRGLPELLMIFIVYFGGQLLLQALVRRFSDAPVEANPFVAGVIALGLISGAYSSEVFTAAFNAIPRGQWEGGYAVGLRRIHVMRLVILPQLFRIALPALGNLWLVLLKDTSYVSAIALNDLLRMTQSAVGTTKEPFLFFFVACMVYLLMSVVSSAGIVALERWVGRGERSRAMRSAAA